jgi:hypothetical protein
MKLTAEEARRIVAFYYANGNSPTRAFRLFNAWAISNNVATRATKKNVIDVVKRFERHAHLQKDTRQRAVKWQDETVLVGVLNSLYRHPGGSLRICASDNDMSYTTTQKIARRALQLYPYRLILVQALSEFDKMVRVEACRRLLDVLTEEKLVIYSDEATFRTDGFVNRWNCRIWDYNRPDDFIVESNQGARSVTVWAGMSQQHLFGPYFFPGTVSGDAYRAVISEMFINDLLQRVGSTEQIWFQQDGAPAHTAGDTKELLQSHFGTRVVSRGFLHEWPPRSPDLTPCDFFLWGVVKDIVYARGRVSSVAELHNRIIEAFNVIRQQRMHHVNNAVQGVRRRMEECISVDGSQLQHR